MVRRTAWLCGSLLALSFAFPALAFNSPLDRGALADFLTLFREEAIPSQVVVWRHPEYSKGTVVISTKERQNSITCLGAAARSNTVSASVARASLGREQRRSAASANGRTGAHRRKCSRGVPELPRYMAGGMENPLGARALYLGSSEYRIHGSNEPDTIGAAVSSGCIRMTNRDVIDLYDRVKVGTKVVVLE